MTENNDQLKILLDKLNDLLKRQENFSKEINELRNEVRNLQALGEIENPESKKETVNIPPIPEINREREDEFVPSVSQSYQSQLSHQQHIPYPGRPPKGHSDFEKTIGENFINKIGIVITVIGVAIGAKYSIEHDLISPLTRIILGYGVGAGLLLFGLKLKRNYENFSAVLVSGAIAIMYFITYAAYTFYGFYPQMVAFALMVVFTALTVAAATYYNKEVIANIGLVGAYAVPLLLSEGSGNVAILFSYIAIINIGILVIAVKKYWKSVYYSSFLLTWLIFILWYFTKFQVGQHLTLAFIFLSIFFITFYLIFLAYKLLHSEKFSGEDIVLLLANSFIFYGLGYSILSTYPSGERLLGLFTLGNAAIHFAVSVLIRMQKMADRNLFYMVAGLVLIFITIAIPVQLDGNWVTLLWAGESVLLFWIGRTRNVYVYERISYALMFLAFFSLIQDWINTYDSLSTAFFSTRIEPIMNIQFLTSVLFIAAFGLINYLNKNKKFEAGTPYRQNMDPLMAMAIPSILLIVTYFSFRNEIALYWDQLYNLSSVEVVPPGQEYPETLRNEDFINFKEIWVINYSLLFFSILALINMLKFRNNKLGLLSVVLITLAVVAFLTQGLYSLGELRETYLNKRLVEYFPGNGFNIWIRYISMAFAAFGLYAFYRTIRHEAFRSDALNVHLAFEFLLYTSILWVASSELITWMDMADSTQTDKLGLSILWGCYALLLIVIGIRKRKKHLRISAIILFAVTLIKLFFYDISYLDTISKTIVFVSLGILLLVISFLYNKYKQFLSDEIEILP